MKAPLKLICCATWPKDSSCLKMVKCKQPADGIYEEVYSGDRNPYCEVHGRFLKLVAKLPKEQSK